MSILTLDPLRTTRSFVDHYPTHLTRLTPCDNWIRRVKYPPCPSMICVTIGNPLGSVPLQLGYIYRALLSLGKVRHVILVYHRFSRFIGLFHRTTTFSLPLVCLTFLMI